jgi:hypothetical protein
MIEVKNKRTFTSGGVYIGRPAILGNPFSHIAKGTLAKYVVASREQSVESYRAYAKEQYKTNPEFKAKINELAKQYAETGKLELVCWCAPLPCHGDVLARVIEFIAKRDYK